MNENCQTPAAAKRGDTCRREHLEPKSIGSQTANAGGRPKQKATDPGNQSRSSSPLPREGLSLSLALVFHHADFDNQSPACGLSSSTAGCKKFSGKVKAMAPMIKARSSGPR